MRKAKNTKGHSGYKDQDDIKDKDKGYVIIDREDGIIGDTNDGKLNPNGSVTKKEADYLIDKMKPEKPVPEKPKPEKPMPIPPSTTPSTPAPENPEPTNPGQNKPTSKPEPTPKPEPTRGYNVVTKQWDQLDYGTTTNGITFTRSLSPGLYSQLEFYYYTNHDCMYVRP
ncbi:hypothetical protein [Tissierella praeacuta]|uniref:hypothetical protein n=1 Tax=Tissierella praeacuta TaxID=43131 RepID=UPI0033415E0A